MASKHSGWRWFALILLAVGGSGYLNAQVCSCGGAPLLSSLEAGSVRQKILRVTVKYEYHNISDLFSGTEQLVNDGRWQVSQSGLLTVSYGLTPTVSLTAIATLVQKERRSGDHVLVRGLGDGLLIANVVLLPTSPFSRQQLVLSVGVKAPAGKSTLSLGGTLLPADLQPTSGAWDGIVSAYYTHRAGAGRPLRIFASAAIRWTGSNQRFDFSDLGYKVGNEVVASLGAGYLWNTRLRTSLAGQFRQSTADRFGGFEIATTGGKWLAVKPAVNVQLSTALSLGLSGQLPIYRNLRGAIQLTTTYAVSAALSYEMGIR